MKETKVKKDDVLTIKVKVTRVRENNLGEQLVTVVVGGQPHTVLLGMLNVVRKD